MCLWVFLKLITLNHGKMLNRNCVSNMLNSILLLTAFSEFCLFAWPPSYREKYFSYIYIYISRETSIQSINHLNTKVALCCAFCECLDSHSEKKGGR